MWGAVGWGGGWDERCLKIVQREVKQETSCFPCPPLVEDEKVNEQWGFQE